MTITEAIAKVREGQAEADRRLPGWALRKCQPYRDATDLCLAELERRLQG